MLRLRWASRKCDRIQAGSFERLSCRLYLSHPQLPQAFLQAWINNRMGTTCRSRQNMTSTNMSGILIMKSWQPNVRRGRYVHVMVHNTLQTRSYSTKSLSAKTPHQLDQLLTICGVQRCLVSERKHPEEVTHKSYTGTSKLPKYTKSSHKEWSKHTAYQQKSSCHNLIWSG